MKRILLLTAVLACIQPHAFAQCASSGFCSNSTNQYPASTMSTSYSSWTTVSAFMNAGNYTLFNVTSGNTYEWSYCESDGGVSVNWDAELTLSNNSSGTNLCFSNNVCGTNNTAPKINWTANFTGVVKLLTSQSPCASNTGSPYNTLVWREVNGTQNIAIKGIDVSNYQTPVNWTQVKAGGISFSFAKSTEGATYTDPSFHTNMTNGTAAGVAMGPYHFARPETNSASAEATFFLSVAGSSIKSCNLPPVLDLEDPPSGPALSASFSSSALTAWVQTWMSAVKTQTGISPVLYTNGSIASYLNSSINTYGLWIADPDGSSTAPPANIGVWNTYLFKQYSFTGTVPGISGQVDLDVYNGNSTAFNALLGCTTAVAEIHPVQEFSVYPNPANDRITIEKENFQPGQNEVISLYNLQGQLILEQAIELQQTLLDISSYPKGMYILLLKTVKGAEVKKFIKN